MTLHISALRRNWNVSLSYSWGWPRRVTAPISPEVLLNCFILASIHMQSPSRFDRVLPKSYKGTDSLLNNFCCVALTICAQPGQSSLPRKWVWTNEISYLSSGVIAWNAVWSDFADMDSTFRNVWLTKATSSIVNVIIGSSILWGCLSIFAPTITWWAIEAYWDLRP